MTSWSMVVVIQGIKGWTPILEDYDMIRIKKKKEAALIGQPPFVRFNLMGQFMNVLISQ